MNLSATLLSLNCVYEFLINKNQTTYEDPPSALLDRVDTLGCQTGPTIVIMDFELAPMKAMT